MILGILVCIQPAWLVEVQRYRGVLKQVAPEPFPGKQDELRYEGNHNRRR